MNNTDRQRINYKPTIDYVKDIDTKYDNLSTSSISNTTIENYSSSNETASDTSKLSDTLRVLKEMMLPESISVGMSALKGIDNELQKMISYIANSYHYNGLIDAINSNDFNLLDKYRELSENISGDIIPEIYPYLLNTKKELSKFIELINAKLFGNLINTERPEDFYDVYHGFVDKLVSLEESIVDNIDTTMDIDYKGISIDAQLYNFVVDRITNLYMFAQKLIAISKMGEVNGFLPKDSIFTNNYFHEILKVYNEDKLKMALFKPQEIIDTLLPDILSLKDIVVFNRKSLLDLNRREFFYVLPTVKVTEDKLDDMVLDLYKIDMSDNVNKDDFINTLYQKEQVRRHYDDVNK